MARSHKVHCVTDVDLSVSSEPLEWEARCRAAIDAQWVDQTARNPALWDGRTHFAVSGAADNGTFRAICRPARFSTLLYWRHQGHPEVGFRTIFGVVILSTVDGAVLLGRMRPETANAGRLYLPGGGFDENDVTGHRIDAADGIARECREETGLSSPHVEWARDYVVYEDDIRIAVGQIARLPWDADESRDRILQHIADSPDPELSDIVIIRSGEDAEHVGAEPYATRLCDWLFSYGVLERGD